jgi:broad specificity phosphatase PhoE
MYDPPIMDASAPCTIYLIRHGRTEWNVTGRWQGHLDVPLDDAGRDQAARLADRLQREGIRFDALYASDLRRARETAEAVGEALDMEVSAVPALREIDLGAWSGMTREEIARKFPTEWKQLHGEEDIARGGGETFAVFQQRVLNWLSSAAETHAGGRICAVTHGGCIRAALLKVRGLSWAGRDRIPPIDNGSITVLEIAGGAWRVLRVNDAEGIVPEGGGDGHPELNEGQLS